MATADPIVDPRLNQQEREVWERVSCSPVPSLWRANGVSARAVARRTFNSAMQDRLLGHASELGFYFLFSLFPTLICASSILGLAARSAPRVYDSLVNYLALVIPTSALGMVVNMFDQATAASSSGKITFGLVAAIWSASAGTSAAQDTLNAVYKLVERRSFFKARAQAIALTIVLIVTVSLCLGSLFAGDMTASWLKHHITERSAASGAAAIARLASWISATIFLTLSFALTYCWAPDLRKRSWRWFSPGTVIGTAGWLLASLGLRIYLHFFNSYSVTYGSLGAVIILLTWFYISGLMLLVGAEINSEIEAVAVETLLAHERSAVSPVAPAV